MGFLDALRNSSGPKMQALERGAKQAGAQSFKDYAASNPSVPPNLGTSSVDPNWAEEEWMVMPKMGASSFNDEYLGENQYDNLWVPGGTHEFEETKKAQRKQADDSAYEEWKKTAADYYDLDKFTGSDYSTALRGLDSRNFQYGLMPAEVQRESGETRDQYNERVRRYAQDKDYLIRYYNETHPEINDVRMAAVEDEKAINKYLFGDEYGISPYGLASEFSGPDRIYAGEDLAANALFDTGRANTMDEAREVARDREERAHHDETGAKEPNEQSTEESPVNIDSSQYYALPQGGQYNVWAQTEEGKAALAKWGIEYDENDPDMAYTIFRTNADPDVWYEAAMTIPGWRWRYEAAIGQDLSTEEGRLAFEEYLFGHAISLDGYYENAPEYFAGLDWRSLANDETDAAMALEYLYSTPEIIPLLAEGKDPYSSAMTHISIDPRYSLSNDSFSADTPLQQEYIVPRAKRGTGVTKANQSSTANEVALGNAQAMYDAYIAAGLSPEEATAGLQRDWGIELSTK